MPTSRDIEHPHEYLLTSHDGSRSPCPALNTLANHGYLPRSGRNITFLQLIRALRVVYNLSLPLAILLSLVGIVFCGHGLRLDLEGLAAHGRIEHDASLVHDDALPGARMAPTNVDHALLRSLLDYSAAKGGFTLDMFAEARWAREKELSKPLDSLHSQIGQGEVALSWLLMRNHGGEVPTKRLSQWWGEERLPNDWKRPVKAVGLLAARETATKVAQTMKRLR